MSATDPRKPKILVVEDETVQAIHLQDIIGELGCEVVGPVGRLEEALKLIRTRHVDMAFLDVRLGRDQEVYPAAQALRKRAIPFIFTTAFDRAAPRDQGFKEATLPKPLERSAIERVIKQFIQSNPAG